MSIKRKQRRERGNADAARQEINSLSEKYPPSPDWEVKVKFETMAERTGFFEDLNNVQETGVESYLFPWAAAFIKRWPWGNAEAGLNPADETSYPQLTPDQWEEAQVRLMTGMAKF